MLIVWLHYAEIAQLVEHWLPKPRVAGSSPVFRSKDKEWQFCLPLLVFCLNVI